MSGNYCTAACWVRAVASSATRDRNAMSSTTRQRSVAGRAEGGVGGIDGRWGTMDGGVGGGSSKTGR